MARNDRKSLINYSPHIIVNGNNARVAGRDMYDNCIIISDEAIKALKGMPQRKLREIRKILETFAKAYEYKYLIESTRSSNVSTAPLIADYKTVVREVVAEECDDYDSVKDKAASELQDSRLEYAEVKREAMTVSEKKRIAAFYVFIALAVACIASLFFIVRYSDIGKVSIIVLLSVGSAIALGFLAIANTIGYGWDEDWNFEFLVALGIVAALIVAAFLVGYTPNIIGGAYKNAYVSVKFVRVTKILFSWLMGVGGMAGVIFLVCLGVNDSGWGLNGSSLDCYMGFNYSSTAIALIGMILAIWISPWFWIATAAGILFSIVCNSIVAVGNKAVDIEERIVAVVGCIGIVIIGYVIASIVERFYPGVIFGTLNKALRNWWNYIIFWKK